MPDDRELDELLDRAMACYSAAEPDASLRARIMAQADAVEQRRWPVWTYAAAAACAAALLPAFLLFPANRALQNRPVQDPVAAAAPAQPPADSARLDRIRTHSTPASVVAAPHRRYRKQPIPRRILRAAAPLTEEEATLLRFAQQHPDQAREVLSPPPSGPLQTDPLVIAPLQIAALSASQPDSH